MRTPAASTHRRSYAAYLITDPRSDDLLDFSEALPAAPTGSSAVWNRVCLTGASAAPVSSHPVVLYNKDVVITCCIGQRLRAHAQPPNAPLDSFSCSLYGSVSLLCLNNAIVAHCRRCAGRNYQRLSIHACRPFIQCHGERDTFHGGCGRGRAIARRSHRFQYQWPACPEHCGRGR